MNHHIINLFLLTLSLGMAIGVLISVEPYHKVLRFLHLDFKPFNCSICLSCWVTFPLMFFYFDFSIVESLIAALGSCYVCDSVNKKLNEY